jgi:hypothetical protein
MKTKGDRHGQGQQQPEKRQEEQKAEARQEQKGCQRQEVTPSKRSRLRAAFFMRR